MIVLGQILSDIEQEKIIKEARKFVSNLHLSDNKYPIGETVDPPMDPEWDYKSNSQKWARNHFLLCVKTGLKVGHQKAINYSKVSAISQGLDENPITFLERLREALIKHTNLDLESYEGQVILKDKFLTQSASDVRRKLQKLLQGSGVSLDKILTTVNVVFYNHNQERQARAQEKEEWKEASTPKF